MGLNSQTAAIWIRKCVTPPIFANDENKTLIARALHFVTLSASATLIVIGINAALFARQKPTSLLFIGVGLAVTLMVNWEIRRGHVERASFMMVAFGWAIVTLFVFLSGGLETISSSLYVTVIIMAALFLGSRAGILVVGLTLVSMLALALLNMVGYNIPRLFPLEGMTNWLLLVYIVILVLIMVIGIESGLREALRYAREQLHEREKAESALRESEERFRLISSATSDYTFSSGFNPAGELEYLLLTGAFEAITGYTPEEFRQVGGWQAVLHPDDLAKDEHDMEALRQNQRVVSDMRIIRKDGQMRWVRVYADPVWEQGRLVGINGAGQDITERKLAEEALRESEERFRLISSVTSDYTFSTSLNIDGTLDYRMLTGAFEAISGYTPEEYYQAGGWLRMLHPDDAAIDARDMELVRQNQRVESEVRIIRKDGEARWVRVYAHPVWDGERVTAINGAVKDITEQKLAEEALRESEERFRLISTMTSDYTFSSRVNEQGGLEHTMLTGAFEAISGYTPEEFLARGGWRTTVHPDDVAQDDRDIETLRQNQRVVTELRVIKKDGEVRWVRVYAHPVWDAEKQRLTRINGAVQDITEQKRLEAEIAVYTEQLEQKVDERTAQLRQAKEQIELILNNSTDAVALAQADGDIQTANPAYYAMFGVQASQSIERILGIVANDEQVLSVSKALMRVIHHNEGKRVEVQIVAPDGTERDIDLALIPVHLRHDDPKCGILVSAHDITNLKEMERFKARFVGNAVHDLGNPITGLLMRLHFLKASPERLDEHVRALENQVEHFRDILEDLRTLSHLDQKQLLIKLAAGNVNDMVQRVFDTYEPVALNKQQTLKFTPAPFLPEAWVDIRRLERVVVNLVTNAINYTPEGKQIDIQTALDGDDVVISIKDEGIGIDSKDAARIFDRFYRTPNARKTHSNGSGLGLAIVKEVIELHGGSVAVKSKPGQGSTFIVRLPVQR